MGRSPRRAGIEAKARDRAWPGDSDKPNAPALCGATREGRVSRVMGTAGSPTQGRPLDGAKGFPRPSCACGSVQTG